jgi:uncharacterized repeat protein (TIGR03833 family)
MASLSPAVAHLGKVVVGRRRMVLQTQPQIRIDPPGMQADPRVRASVRPGMTVLVVTKQDQGTGRTTQGVVKDVLTRSPTHPRGIKVRLQNGQIGRVVGIVEGGT